MLKNRLLSHTARRTGRGGFTLVELLVVIGIIAILAGVALGPITHGLENAKESAGLQTARTIALADFQYANDNGYVYASGTKSEDVAVALILGQYISDPSIFAASRNVAFSGTTSSLTLTNGSSGGFPSTAICWDFMTGPPPATGSGPNTGLGTSDPDGMPLVFSTGQTVNVPADGSTYTGIQVNQKGTNPFGTNGVAVCFKSNSAQFLKSTLSNGTAQINTGANNALFNASFSVTTPSNYHQIIP